ncbi:MAG: phosphoethanolamine--lipid A transferase [Deltaproteobacteria bacterium]|nr:phosphoethanolamine--lipid A transferase [Deltaproteobacteria bacterium]
MRKITTVRLIIGAALLLTAGYNTAFFRQVLRVYPPAGANLLYLASLAVGLTCFFTLLLALCSSRYVLKPLLVLVFLVSSLAAYFLNSYQIVIDDNMIRNISQTNIREAAELLSPLLLGYFLGLGVVPAIIVSRLRLADRDDPWRRKLWRTARLLLACLAILAALLLGSGRFYASFFREHKPLRSYINPTYMVYSLIKYGRQRLEREPAAVKPIGLDARLREPASKKLVVLVVGEAARADRLALNGYRRPTTPRLRADRVISFAHMYASGTSTATAVPCMFSPYNRPQCSYRRCRRTENLLDVLRHAGVAILWRDNNSSSKGVAARVPYEDFRRPTVNPVCNPECRDEGMLAGLDDFVARHRDDSILIVLHQMGNHGPAYYRRYPPAFAKFKPVCRSSQLEQCSRAEIDNAYDNAILYTDYFLDRVITFLRRHEHRFATAMVYLSDHGESLGENGIYLHGMPYFMAPEAQIHIAALMWFGPGFKIDREALRRKASRQRFSQDNLFATMLGLFAVDTKVYRQSQDIINGSQPPARPAVPPAPGCPGG